MGREEGGEGKEEEIRVKRGGRVKGREEEKRRDETSEGGGNEG